MISHIHHETSSADPVGLDLFQMKSVSLKWTSLRTAQRHWGQPRDTEDSSETLRTAQRHWGQPRDTEDSSETLRTAQRHWGQPETLRTAQRHWGQLRYTETATLRTAQRHWGQLRDTEDSPETLRTAQIHWGQPRDTEESSETLRTPPPPCVSHTPHSTAAFYLCPSSRFPERDRSSVFNTDGDVCRAKWSCDRGKELCTRWQEEFHWYPCLLATGTDGTTPLAPDGSWCQRWGICSW